MKMLTISCVVQRALMDADTAICSHQQHQDARLGGGGADRADVHTSKQILNL